MGPYGFANSAQTSSGSSSSSSAKPPNDIDGLLGCSGYKVRSSDLRHVAQPLEHLETVMSVNSPAVDISQLASDAVHYHPSDIGSSVDSVLSEFFFPPPPFSSYLPDFPDFMINGDAISLNQTAGNEFWPDHATPQQHQNIAVVNQNPHHQLMVVTATEEDSGIRLVHTLVKCAESIQRGNLALASSLIENVQALLTRVNTNCGIGKVAGYFIDALSRRIFSPAPSSAFGSFGLIYENEVLYHNFYEVSPYLKFAHFTANQTIFEAFNGYDCVHVIDFNIMYGLQWPTFIQALALRSGGPPFLRLTGIGPPSPDRRDSLPEIGLWLAKLASSVNVRFAFRGVAALRLDDVKPWMVQASPKEAVAVNSIMQLHRLLGSDPTRTPPIDSVLSWIRLLNPKIVTVVEQEASHNQTGFLDRFTEALHYYSTMFDSLEACSLQPEKALAEKYIQREICNVVCCEGSARVERHEPLDKWRSRLARAGFKPIHLGSNAFKQASMLLTLFSAEGYSVEEKEGCLTLGWHSRPLIAASAWQAVAEPNNPLGVLKP